MVIQLNGSELEALWGLTQYRPRHIAIAARYPRDDGCSAAPLIVELLQERGYTTEIDEHDFVFAVDRVGLE